MGLRGATYDKLLTSGVPYRHAIDLDARTTVIRVVVRTPLTNFFNPVSAIEYSAA
jgi:hypothetical protein